MRTSLLCACPHALKMASMVSSTLPRACAMANRLALVGGATSRPVAILPKRCIQPMSGGCDASAAYTDDDYWRAKFLDRLPNCWCNDEAPYSSLYTTPFQNDIKENIEQCLCTHPDLFDNKPMTYCTWLKPQRLITGDQLSQGDNEQKRFFSTDKKPPNDGKKAEDVKASPEKHKKDKKDKKDNKDLKAVKSDSKKPADKVSCFLGPFCNMFKGLKGKADGDGKKDKPKVDNKVVPPIVVAPPTLKGEKGVKFDDKNCKDKEKKVKKVDPCKAKKDECKKPKVKKDDCKKPNPKKQTCQAKKESSKVECNKPKKKKDECKKPKKDECKKPKKDDCKSKKGSACITKKPFCRTKKKKSGCKKSKKCSKTKSKDSCKKPKKDKCKKKASSGSVCTKKSSKSVCSKKSKKDKCKKKKPKKTVCVTKKKKPVCKRKKSTCGKPKKDTCKKKPKKDKCKKKKAKKCSSKNKCNTITKPHKMNRQGKMCPKGEKDCKKSKSKSDCGGGGGGGDESKVFDVTQCAGAKKGQKLKKKKCVRDKVFLMNEKKKKKDGGGGSGAGSCGCGGGGAGMTCAGGPTCQGLEIGEKMFKRHMSGPSGSMQDGDCGERELTSREKLMAAAKLNVLDNFPHALNQDQEYIEEVEDYHGDDYKNNEYYMFHRMTYNDLHLFLHPQRGQPHTPLMAKKHTDVVEEDDEGKDED